jgi:hypothetical protein
MLKRCRMDRKSTGNLSYLIVAWCAVVVPAPPGKDDGGRMLLPVNVEPVPSPPLTAGAALPHPEAAAHRAQRPTHHLKVQVCLHPDSSAALTHPEAAAHRAQRPTHHLKDQTHLQSSKADSTDATGSTTKITVLLCHKGRPDPNPRQW